MLKDNIVLKWFHRFGIDSLHDLLIHSPALREYQDEEENQAQINLELFKNIEITEEKKRESDCVNNPEITGIFSKNQNSNNIKQLTNTQNLPLPNLKNLRKWINNDKKAS